MVVRSFLLYLVLLVLAGFLGYYTYLGFAPFFNQWILYLGLAGYILMLNIKVQFNPHKPARRGSYLLPYVWDTAFTVGTLYWLKDAAIDYGSLSNLGAFLLLLSIAMVFSLKSIVVAIIWNARAKYYALLPIVITVVYYLMQTYLYHFDWLNLGYTGLDKAALVLAPIGGVSLLQFLKLSVACLGVGIITNFIRFRINNSKFSKSQLYTLYSKSMPTKISLYQTNAAVRLGDMFVLAIPVVILVGSSLGLGYKLYTTPVGKAEEVALVQPNFHGIVAPTPADYLQQSQTYNTILQGIIKRPQANIPALVLLPENSIADEFPNVALTYLKFAQELIAHNSQLLAGSTYLFPQNQAAQQVLDHQKMIIEKTDLTKFDVNKLENYQGVIGKKPDSLPQANLTNNSNSSTNTTNKSSTNTVFETAQEPLFLRYNTALMFTSKNVATDNAITIVDKGIKIQYYNKRHLVPFGEYLPLNLLKSFGPFFVSLSKYGYSEGHTQQANLSTSFGKFAIGICYDTLFGRELAQEIKSQTAGIISISNDVWFGNSEGPKQHLNIARYRAIENQRYVLRDSNNGITAIINQEGKIIADLPSNTQATLYGKFQAFNGQTPYEAYPWLNKLLLGLFTLFSLVITGIIAISRKHRI